MRCSRLMAGLCARSVALAAVLLAACASAAGGPPAGDAKPTKVESRPATAASSPGATADPYPSTYKPLPSRPTLLRNATVLTAAGPAIEGGSVLLVGGKVAAVGRDVQAPADAVVVDASGRWVTPGVIDIHSHLGVYASPGVEAHSDGNEATDPVTAEVWAEHSVWPQDPQFPLALAGGVTAMQILPGSANLIGGRSVTLKNVPARTVQAMKFPGAPYGLKMACGENPKRVYGNRNRAPSTRMGNVAGYRAAFIEAQRYRQEWDDYRKEQEEGGGGSRDDEGDHDNDAPEVDLAMETLAGVLEGKILVHNHCYRADEMAVMLDLGREFGFKIAAFHHAVEAYKVADLLAQAGTCGAMWADWWGFKMEALDGIRENIALVDAAGGCAIVHSDSAEGIQRLNQEAAKSMAAANRAGIPVTREQAIRWLTINPARAMGIGDLTGSLEPGKMADVVVWSGDPFSVYSKADQVYVDGALVYERGNPALTPRTDFSLGQEGSR